MKKIIQIVCSECETDSALYALTEDGSVYIRTQELHGEKVEVGRGTVRQKSRHYWKEIPVEQII
jgi:hypothetical protein